MNTSLSSNQEPNGTEAQSGAASTTPTQTPPIPWTPVALPLRSDASAAAVMFGEFASRPLEVLARLEGQGVYEQLDAHLGGHPNHVGWLLWHAGRQFDIQFAQLSGLDELWPDYREHFSLGPLGDTMGYGHSAEEVAQIRVTPAQAPHLCEYLRTCLLRAVEYTATLSTQQLDAIVDNNWDPAITRRARLVSIVDDVVAHLAHIDFILGA